MKRWLFVFALVFVASHADAASGNFTYNNISPSFAPVSIGAMGVPGEGGIGAYVGADYTASAFYVTGSVLNQAAFDAAHPIYVPSSDVQFLGSTGSGPSDPIHNPSDDGAGTFDSGGYLTVPITGKITVEIRVWYNGNGLYTSYGQALSAGVNFGESNPVSITLGSVLSPPAQLDGLLPFQVVASPEPSIMAMCAFGLAAIFLGVRKR